MTIARSCGRPGTHEHARADLQGARGLGHVPGLRRAVREAVPHRRRDPDPELARRAGQGRRAYRPAEQCAAARAGSAGQMSPTVTDEPVLTSEQAAALLKVDVDTLRALPI